MFIPEEYKIQIRILLVSYLDQFQIKYIRDQIDSCLQMICKIDFPQNFPQLFEYFIKNIDGLKGVLISEEQLFNPVTKNFIRTLKIIIREQTRRRGGGGNKKIFYDYSYNLLMRFREIWNYLNINFRNAILGATKDNVDKIIQYIQLARYCDNTMSNILIGGYTEMHTE